MPYEWVSPQIPSKPDPQTFTPSRGYPLQDAPLALPAEVHLWPYRSLPRRGFVLFIGLTCALLCLPVIALIGLAVLWVLLPFVILVVWGLWYALQRSYRDGEILEILQITPETIRLTRRSRPRDRRAKADAKAANHPAWQEKTWEANPYWVRLRSHSEPLPEYLTLTGGPREVELGAFMTPEERRRLSAEITTLLRAARRANPQGDMAD